MRAIQAEAKAGSASTLAWVLMPDHFHWLLQLGNADLNHVLRRVKSRSTLEFKRVQELPWALWQKHFYDRALRMDEEVAAAARYVICNPLRRVSTHL
ncbi:hypothetical protein HBH25_20675 [Pseudomonas sp. hsmgli-8]|uniref:Transposase IS200-like domain-containing protein n=1 Tax=Pseudomonas quercus TaxID=2722792 RepID=A0ABX0YII4_9PSED|nr:transposase [Pseudomonas sp. LY10J]NJP03254.1 hypothetical protein [Pseudomonas quercus]